jgi:hypothetical protein
LPVAIKVVTSITGLSHLSAGLLVVNASFLAALIYVYYYARLLGCERGTALLAVALLSLAPQGFIFAIPYSEALFVLLLAAAMYHTLKGHYLAAGLAAALLSAVRPNGILFVVFPIAVILRRYGVKAFLRPWERPAVFVPIVLAPLGLFAFWVFSYATVGDAFAHVTSAAHGWGWGSGFPPANLVLFATSNTLSRYWLVATLVAFFASLLLLRYRMYEEFALTSAMFLLFWTAQVPWSMLRLAIVLFPIWIALARWLVHRPVVAAITCSLMGVVNGLLIVAWVLVSPIAT